ncbi:MULTISPECIES: hypothetical protein [unclassified Microcoleus]|jgi:hypothetical protein|uniref:hypothetical protein n=1 Tax=unclassified Microcoleus TaxID=2642155 RepID=UPI001DA1A6C6|nr:MULTISPECIES: hypothetical protein [unclassified Microcoleus]MCC3432881.1 hypothetical protein [Microcoleus sp. PH2017_04_SCI_O_A]MCC3442869.1 hypothetical protein [Microcoleus sp. PH2017_03_ELD_O_A]MCC3505337.1 hypothetical protein [Microcoleus sp. PH2017_19_SFW_U_A]TAE08143.1 MAG: hypothetical protein EAZ94_26115 [Oscillatoriales cyanobacterium]MCC3413170.1 hypothetical protein [Microcoleus sp. PH2017_02_FOX_O_A]
MAYSDFSLARVKKDFGLTLDETRNLFADTEPVTPSEILTTILIDYVPLATFISTQKARSEFLIAPILAEVRRMLNKRVSLFSGKDFIVDPERGLQGFCDYIMSGSPEQLFISAPVVTIFEAKKEDIMGGLGQCVAAMVAAQSFNQNQDTEIDRIYGAVTTGTNWKFLILEETTVYIDQIEYYIQDVDKILGILLQPFHQSFVKIDP